MEKNQGSGYEQYDIMYITLKYAKQNNTLFINICAIILKHAQDW